LTVVKNDKVIVIIVFVTAAATTLFWFQPTDENSGGDLSSFARCLTDKGYIMYGADWCPHCQKEKEAFGEFFANINYVECPKEPQKCLMAGIQKYPTWIISDGYSLTGSPIQRKKLEGEQGIENLAKKSGCSLP